MRLHRSIFVIFIFVFLSSDHLISQNNYSNSSSTHIENHLKETKNITITSIKLSEFKIFRLEENVKCCSNDTKCPITGFHLLKNGTIQTYNGGPRFSSASRYLISKAEAGDIFSLENIKYKCSFTNNVAYLKDLAFKIVRE